MITNGWRSAANANAPITPNFTYNISHTYPRPEDITSPNGPNTMNKAKDDTIIVKVGTSTNDNTCGTYLVINFSNWAKKNYVNIAGNIPPWNATAGMLNPNRFQ